MSKSVLREISVRFLEVLDALIEKGAVDNMKEFCNRVNYLPQSMSQIKNGKRDVTIPLIVKLYHEFGGNPVYVLLGQGDKILEGKTIPTIAKNSLGLEYGAMEEKLVHKLEELVESKNEYIQLLKKEIDRLTSELGKRK